MLFGDSLIQGAAQIQDGYSFQGELQHREFRARCPRRALLNTASRSHTRRLQPQVRRREPGLLGLHHGECPRVPPADHRPRLGIYPQDRLLRETSPLPSRRNHQHAADKTRSSSYWAPTTPSSTSPGRASTFRSPATRTTSARSSRTPPSRATRRASTSSRRRPSTRSTPRGAARRSATRSRSGARPSARRTPRLRGRSRRRRAWGSWTCTRA